MFNKHLFKVILGFCGMIVLGLGLLVVINSFKTSKKEVIVEVVPPVQASDTAKTSAKSTFKKQAIPAKPIQR